MTEPVYEFVPGKGWVVENYRSLTFMNRAGTHRLTLVDRRPRIGEAYIYGPVWFEDGVADLQKFKGHAENHDYVKGMKATELDTVDPHCIAVLSEPVSGLRPPNV